MKTLAISPVINLNSFYNFAKMSLTQKEEVLKHKGIYFDCFCEHDLKTNIYYLNGFYVEEIFDKKENILQDIIPFKNGYRIQPEDFIFN